MSTTTNLDTLKINYLTQAQYDEALENNEINENELYMTPSYQGIFNLFYPVGSYYETSDANFDPNISWGGTWQLETSGQVHISAGTGYTIGSTGGSKDAIIPYHNHTFTGSALATHTHTFTGSALGTHTHTFTGSQMATHNHTFTGTALGTHTHTFSGNSHTFRARKYANSTTATATNIVWNGTGTTDTAVSTAVSRVIANGQSAASSCNDISWTDGGTNSSVSAGTPSGTVGAKTAGTPSGTNSSVSAGTPSGTISYAGSSGNLTDANMQPYIVVNRWHRVA